MISQQRLTGFVIANACSDEGWLPSIMMLKYLQPQMLLDALPLSLIQSVQQLQAALQLQPGRVRIAPAGGNLESSRTTNNEYEHQWVCLQPGKTFYKLQPDTRYQVRKSDHYGNLYLRDANGRDLDGYFNYSCLALFIDGLPLHAALKSNLPREIVASLLAADPATASVPDADGLLALHAAVKCKLPAESVNMLLAAFPQAASIPDAEGHALNAQMYPADIIATLVAAFPQAADATVLGPTRLPAETIALLANITMQATKNEVQATKMAVQEIHSLLREKNTGELERSVIEDLPLTPMQRRIATTNVLRRTKSEVITELQATQSEVQATKSELQATKSEVISEVQCLRDEMQRERELHRDEMKKESDLHRDELRSLRSEMAEIKGYLVALSRSSSPPHHTWEGGWAQRTG